MLAEPKQVLPNSAQRLEGKYLIFDVHGESYGIDVLKVREIIRLADITPVPQMPDYVRGVINLRGKIVPVVDLRLRFGFTETQNTEQTCIIVALLKLADGKVNQMGLIVDGPEEVVNVAAADIEETPDFGPGSFVEFILGMAKVKGVVKTLLDIDRVMAAEGRVVVQNAQAFCQSEIASAKK